MYKDQAERMVAIVFVLFVVVMLISPMIARAGGGTKLKVPLVQPGPGSVTGGYNAWSSGYGVCRARYWVDGKPGAEQQTVFEGNISNGSITYEDSDGITHTVSGLVGSELKNGLIWVYKCVNRPAERTPRRTRGKTRGGRSYDGRLQ